MKKAIKEIAIFIVIIIICDNLIGLTLRKYYFRQKKGIGYHITQSIEKTTSDILIFGTSRAQHQYVPYILESITRHSCYNVGQSGLNIFYDLAVQTAILKRYKPKAIILDVYPIDLLVKNKSEYQRLSYLLPYCKEHEEIWPIVKMRSKFEKYKMISKIYPFNSEILPIYYNTFSRKKNEYFNGYIPLHNKLNSFKLDSMNYSGVEIDTNKINAFELFIKNAQKEDYQLFIFITPVYLIPDHAYTVAYDIVKSIIEKHNVIFKDFSHEPMFISHPKLFNDKVHLNENGAVAYSKIVADQIRKALY